MSTRAVLVGVALLGVLALAGWFRFYDIQQYPPGLFPDEAANGEDALLIMQGDMRPFYPRGNGREGIFFYLDALSIQLFGIGVWQLHVVPAIIGLLTVLAVYFATRPWFGRLAGLLSSLFLATNHWHVTLSRTGFRAILTPLFVAAFTAFAGYTIMAVKKEKRAASYVYAALAGAAFAGGFYSYIAYRVMVGVVGGVFILLLLAAAHPAIGFPHFRRYGKQFVISVLAAVLVILPLALYFVDHPKDFVGRAGQVSVFNHDLQQEFGGGTLVGTVLYTTRETLLSFFAGNGDLNWRHNVVGYPLLNPLVGTLFLLGLAWALQGTVIVFVKLIRGQEVHLGMIYPYLLLLTVGMLFPVITSAQALPHGLRSLGLLIPIFMLAGTAGAVGIHWLWRGAYASVLRGIAYGVMVGAMLVGIAYDGALYFGIARNTSDAYYAYRADLTRVSNYILDYVQEHPDAPKPYLVLDKFSLQTTHFLTHTISANGSITPPPHDYHDHPDEAEHRYRSVEPETSHLVPLSADDVIIFTQSTMVDADRYAERQPDIQLLTSETNRFGQEILRVYQHAEPRSAGAGEVQGAFDLDASAQ